MPGRTGFFDPFFWMVTVICALMVFVHFLLTPQEKARMKGVAEKWWRYIDKNNLFTLASGEAVFAHRQATSFFGDRTLSAKSGIASILLTLVGVAPFVWYSLGHSQDMVRFSGFPTFDISIYAAYLPTTALFCYISLRATMYLLRLMSETLSLQVIFALLALDVAIAIFLAWLGACRT